MLNLIQIIKGLFVTPPKEDEDELNAQVERTYKVIARNIESASNYFELELCQQLIDNRLLSYPYNYKVKACLFALRIQWEHKKRMIEKQHPRLAN